MAESQSPRKVIGSFVGTGFSDHLPAAARIVNGGTLTLQIYGTYDATIDLVRSDDDGVTFRAIAGETYSTANANVDLIVEIGSPVFVYALECTAYSSGTANFVIAQ